MTLDWFEKMIARREKEAERDYAYKFEIFKEDGVWTDNEIYFINNNFYSY